MTKPIKFMEIMRLIWDTLWTYIKDALDNFWTKIVATFVR